MLQFVLRRLLLSIPVLFGIIFLVFALTRLLPGDPCYAALGERASPQICEAFNERFGLNEPIPVQFLSYLGQLASGDLGDSIRQGRPVAEILLERLPVTLELTLFALIFATVIGMSLGRLAAMRRNSPLDVATMFLANLGVSIPVFVLGLLLAYLFAVTLRGTPLALPPSGLLSAGVPHMSLSEAWGLGEVDGFAGTVLTFFSNMVIFSSLISFQWEPFLDGLKHMILPMIALGTIPMAIIARMTRSSMLDVLGLDYIRTARAKGAPERIVRSRHAFRNALLPVVTIIGLSLGALLSGAVLTESIFLLPGVGRTLFEAITGRDYIVVQAFTLVTAVAYVLINLIVDISYGYLDPRIRMR
ncbi:MAG: ABC transporter permease [Chloroflexota bacterium]|jgi:peptide/nickel transport system permease protein|nr:ABC transporter permease [Chloroflexota bacterium]